MIKKTPPFEGVFRSANVSALRNALVHFGGLARASRRRARAGSASGIARGEIRSARLG
jgi:hypothetical protein